MNILRTATLITASFSLAAGLSACTAVIPLEPAALANDPKCAEISVRLPDRVAGLQKRQTNAQATGAWGDPAAVILRCGLAGVEVSPLLCVSAGNVDWLVDDSNAPTYRFVTFARNPATEVIIDSTVSSGTTVLDELGVAVGSIKATKLCSSVN
jgi:hypothetical protein